MVINVVSDVHMDYNIVIDQSYRKLYIRLHRIDLIDCIYHIDHGES